MRTWEQEIDLILRGELRRAAQVYCQHQTGIKFEDALRVVGDVAKTMRVVVIPKFEKVKVKR